jgi:hypothetical protein
LGSAALCSLAIETGFCKRSSKLTPEVFFDLLFYATSLCRNSSLEYLVSWLESKYRIVMSKQSLDERFTERAVNFVKRVLEQLIFSQFSDLLYSADFLSHFRHVRIKDSTKFNVPSNLAAHYSGSGGSGSTSDAGICIQYEYDLKTGKFLDLTITAATRNDQTDASETTENLCEGDLVLRDLGYFSISVLRAIIAKRAFFLSRLKTSVSVYHAIFSPADGEDYVEFDFKKCYESMIQHSVSKCDLPVLIGSKEKLPVRLYIGLVPQPVYEKRLRQRKIEEKKKGRQMTERTKFLLWFNLFVTNVEEDKLPLEKVMPLYSFRWQVELNFKFWKSVFSIHKLQKMKEERYITMLYIRLILIIVNLQIIYKAQSLLYEQEERDAVLSYQKALQTMQNSFFDLLNILRCKPEKASGFLDDLYRTLSKNHWREKRKNSENFIENICLFSCISEN